VLIAGGIGITPILSMIRTLTSWKKDWKLHYAVRTRARAAFLDELLRLAADKPQRLQLHVDDEHAGHVLDLAQIASEADDHTHLYCCGPTMMLEAFEKATADTPACRVHVEYFSAKGPLVPQGGYIVELARSGLALAVPEGATILDALLEAGVDVPFSCSEGICGTCRTGVLSGTPQHRDLVLSDAERSANQEMMICCSGSEGDRLVLDL
jgi:vanillate O-demethylase ferredoxin subunit